MTGTSDFLSYILDDLLSSLTGLSSRNMFGGTAVYKDGTVFAMIVDDELYFKVATDSIERFKKEGSRPFTYSHKGKEIAMSYWLVPDRVLDDKEEFVVWAHQAIKDQSKSKHDKKEK